MNTFPDFKPVRRVKDVLEAFLFTLPRLRDAMTLSEDFY